MFMYCRQHFLEGTKHQPGLKFTVEAHPGLLPEGEQGGTVEGTALPWRPLSQGLGILGGGTEKREVVLSKPGFELVGPDGSGEHLFYFDKVHETF